jgi:hypothetical protein
MLGAESTRNMQSNFAVKNKDDCLKLLIQLIYIMKNCNTANDEVERTRKEASLSCFRVAFQSFLRVGEINHEN